jgi:hypothetical protein
MGGDMAPLLGMLSLFCGLWFLIGMPLIAVSIAWEHRRTRKLTTGLLVSVVMIAVFYLSAVIIWRLGTRDWNLSFLQTIDASVNSEKYGEPVEHRAERMVSWLLIYSTFIAAVSGAATACSRRRWLRRRHPPGWREDSRPSV